MASTSHVERRMDRLEHQMAELASTVERTSQHVDQLSREMREAGERSEREMSAFREEMRASREEMRAFREEMREARERADQRSEREIRALRQSIAEVSHKMGTLAEDLVAPSVPRIMKEVLGCPEDPELLGVRIRKRLPDGRSKEYDVIAISSDYLLVNETKSRLRPGDVRSFLGSLRSVREYLPEYAGKRIVGALASFYIDRTVATYGERQGLIMLGVENGLMTVLNSGGFAPRIH